MATAAAVSFALACLAATAARAAVPWASEYSNEPLPPPPPACEAINATGVDYADANLTVVPAGGGGHGGPGDDDHGCCAACQFYNAQAHHGPNCSFAVWHRDSAVCALKATANS